MNLNAAIIDQQLNGLKEKIGDKLKDELKLRDSQIIPVSFVYLCVQKILGLDDEDTFDTLTEGGGDKGIDAIYISTLSETQFEVVLFQGKYDNNLEATKNFPENSIKLLFDAIRNIFNPTSNTIFGNNRLKLKIEEIRSMIKDGFIPNIRVIACNNGQKWTVETEKEINEANFGSQVSWEYFNHDSLFELMQKQEPVNINIHSKGHSIIEDINYCRVCIGKISLFEIYELMEIYGEKLLEKNIRRYLGLNKNRVNEEIKDTILSKTPEYFYFLNNGITMICDKLEYNGLQTADNIIPAKNVQIINGGQTCMTIYKTLKNFISEDSKIQLMKNVMVLFRLYQLPSNSTDDFIAKITYATNSQNPVDLRDLKANDEVQKQLEININHLGFKYIRKRTDVTANKENNITISTASIAILSVILQKPQQAKFYSRDHFGKLYNEIFNPNINGSQVIISVLLYRIAENHRKRPLENDKIFVSYASCFIAMQMGKILLKETSLEDYTEINHKNFGSIKFLLNDKGEEYFKQASEQIEYAIEKLYNKKVSDISLQQLAATFRRGDLIEYLDCM